MQIPYYATRVKICNLFIFSKNFIAKTLELRKFRSSATGAYDKAIKK